MKHLIQALLIDDSGQDIIEYALMAALVGLGSVSAMSSLASSIYKFYDAIAIALGQVPTS
jgi:pilus assembly protein Flp/PilA